MEEEKYIGIIEDPRSLYEKSLDYKHDGLCASGLPYEWKEKTNFRSFKIKNQDGSSSCVAQATAKLLGIHEVIEGREYVDLSPKFIYTRRSNYPDGGMYLHNALEIACKFGTCKESTLPSDFTGESYMNDKTQETAICAKEALQYRGKNYVSFNTIDIDEIASVIEQGYGVLLGLRFDYDEWTTIPTLNPKSKQSCGHGVAGIDAGLYNGVKVIAIDDSWGPKHGKGGQRLLTEEFLKARCFWAGYAVSLVKEETGEEFHYVWTTNMRFYSPRNVAKDVSALQKALQTKGYFPKNAKIDGIFGPITLRAVKDFQKAFNLKVDGIVGPKTLAVLNTQYK